MIGGGVSYDEFTLPSMGDEVIGDIAPLQYSAALETPKNEAFVKEYRAKFATPFVAGARGFIDDVIMPHSTRRRICRSLAMLRGKKLDNPWKKHDNIPL